MWLAAIDAHFPCHTHTHNVRETNEPTTPSTHCGCAQQGRRINMALVSKHLITPKY